LSRRILATEVQGLQNGTGLASMPAVDSAEFGPSISETDSPGVPFRKNTGFSN
jgi:hypothetical protein